MSKASFGATVAVPGVGIFPARVLVEHHTIDDCTCIEAVTLSQAELTKEQYEGLARKIQQTLEETS